MNKLLLCLLFSVISVTAFSQRVYFVYLQSEQEQPFFVRMNEKVYSSSPSGYLILSKLRDSSYNLSIGFPQAKWPEQNFTLVVKAKDQGYLLKNFDAKGWGLFDLQTLSVQMATSAVIKEATSKSETKDISAFTDILAKAADDASLREKPVAVKVDEKKVEEKIVTPDTIVAKKEEPKVEIKEPVVIKPAEVVEKPVVKTDPPKTEVREEAILKKEEPQKETKEAVVVKTDEQKPVEEVEYKRSIVTRRSESSTTEGFGLVFIDELSSGAKDTIRILIPNPKPVTSLVKEVPKEEKKFLEMTTDTIAAIKEIKETQPETKKEEPKIIEVKQPAIDTVVTKSLATSKNCKELASEADFLKLRKAMASTETDDDMLDEARKYFKTKCFTTVQVKNLGALFLSDAGKYKFFDQAYSYVSDSDNFPSLQLELKDEYYINRFKAMLRN